MLTAIIKKNEIMATFKAIVFQGGRHLKKDGTSNIKIRIYHNGNSQYISTEYFVRPEFVGDDGLISSYSDENEALNYEITELVQRYRKIYIKLGNARTSKMTCVVMKDAPKAEIEEGLRKAKRHIQYICTRIGWQLQHKEEKKDESASPLTATERDILKLMALGKTTKEIAAGRFLSVYTVMTHRKNIFRKLEVNNVHEATKYALRAGIIDAVEYYI